MISVFILSSNIIFWKTESERVRVRSCPRVKRERERGRRESPLLATHELQLHWRPRDFAPRTHELVFDFTHMPRAQIMPRTQSLRLHRKPTNRSLSVCDFDFCVILIFVVVVVVWVVLFWWFSCCVVVGFACLLSVVAFDCWSLLPWVELEFRWCVVLFRWWV